MFCVYALALLQDAHHARYRAHADAAALPQWMNSSYRGLFLAESNIVLLPNA